MCSHSNENPFKMMDFMTIINISLVVITVIAFLKAFLKRSMSIQKRHVMITGGSSGIGKALAIEAAQKGANVTIIARNIKTLEEAKTEIEANFVEPNTQKVKIVSQDISVDDVAIKEFINEAEKELGPVFVLINCAGTSISGRFEKVPSGEYLRMMNVNYMSAVNVTLPIIPLMKARKEGYVSFTSSVAGVFGLYGYTAYSASKFALRGLAESLQMEVKPFNIKVSLSLPPDTDTPGFANEEKSKPRETRELSESGGLFTASHVAKCMLESILDGKFMIPIGSISLLISNLCVGMSPVTSKLELFAQVFTMGISRVFGACFLWICDYKVNAIHKEKQNSKK